MSGKPKITFVLDTALVTPGSAISGRFVVDVFERPFGLTGAYVELTGKEYSHVTFGRGVKKIILPSWFTHLSMRRTVYGVSKESAREGGGVTLEPGHYEFPFSLTLPLDAPPTYGWDAYKCGSRVTYKLHGALSVPYCQSIHTDRPVTVLPAVSYAQAAAVQDQVQCSGPRQVPVMRVLGLRKSKSEFVHVELQVCPAVVVLGGTMADLYYQEQRQVAAGTRGQAVTGLQLGIAEDDSDDDNDDEEDLKKQKKGGRASKKDRRRRKSRRADRKDNGDETDDDDGDDDDGDDSSSCTSDEAPRGSRRRLREPLQGKLTQLWCGDAASRAPLRETSTAAGPVVCVRVILQNRTAEAIYTFAVALRQLREARVLKMQRSDTVTLSTVTVTLAAGKGCSPGQSITADVELPLPRNMHYHLSRRERRRGLTKVQRRLPQPTLRTANFSCETLVDVTFPKNSLHKEMGRFAGCVQVVEVVGAPGVPNLTIPATFSRAIVDIE